MSATQAVPPEVLLVLRTFSERDVLLYFANTTRFYMNAQKKNATFFKKWSLYPRKVIVKFGIYPRLGETTIL